METNFMIIKGYLHDFNWPLRKIKIILIILYIIQNGTKSLDFLEFSAVPI